MHGHASAEKHHLSRIALNVVIKSELKIFHSDFEILPVVRTRNRARWYHRNMMM